MKTTLLFLSLLLMSAQYVISQTCTPNPMYADSSAGVYPLPYNADTNPMGGIQDTACINQYFEFSLTAIIPESIDLGTFSIDINSLSLDSVINLPSGMDFLCTPNDCIYPANSQGCILVYGTPDDSNTESVYDILVFATANTAIGPVALTFPGLLGSGNYFLFLNTESECNTSSIDPLFIDSGLEVYPNPNNGSFILDFKDAIGITFDYEIYNATGQSLSSEKNISNNQSINIPSVKPGIYFIKAAYNNQTFVKMISVY